MSTKHMTSNIDLSDPEYRQRRRQWNRDPLQDLFPRIPPAALERVLDICINLNFTYNTSESRHWNARRYSSIVVAHVRHFYTDYDKLLSVDREERFAARKRTSGRVWKILREWCPWDEANEVLERSFQATLLRPEERGPEWDPMDIDDERFFATTNVESSNNLVEIDHGDPMDLD
jgi:hypothetical protein